MIQAGCMRIDITPELGAEMPGSMQKRFAKGVHDPLFAHAMVLDNGEAAVALVGLDALSVKRSIVTKAREMISERTDVPASHVMVAASHTHNGGPIADCFLSESDPAYCERVAQAVAEAVIQAWQCREPVSLTVGKGFEDSVAFNRRFRMKDGTERMHPGKGNPDTAGIAGPVDPQVSAIGAINQKGRFLGCWAHFTCHGTLGVGGNGFSADYPYYLARAIQRVMGNEDAVVSFANGACGDVTQVNNLGTHEREFGERWGWHVGTTVGAEVIKILARM